MRVISLLEANHSSRSQRSSAGRCSGLESCVCQVLQNRLGHVPRKLSGVSAGRYLRAAALGERLGPDQREGHGAFPFHQSSKKWFSRVAGAEPPRGMGGAQCGRQCH